jgi:hypothetical protein
MPRRLMILNILLGALSCLFAVVLIREVLVVRPLPPPPVVRPTPPPSPLAPTIAPEGVVAYGVIVAKNLFSPSRSEMMADAVVAGPTPVLHGVVMNGEKSRAYLEDPVTKRITGYAIGDSIGGGRLQAIRSDRVLIGRPQGTVEVLLQDPSKPKPAAPLPSVGTADRPPTPTTAPVPTTEPVSPSLAPSAGRPRRSPD